MDHLKHNAYVLSKLLANKIWPIVQSWRQFEQKTVGQQLVRSADSISSNIAEGWARYYKKDKLLFFNYARSSLAETQDWLMKSFERKLIGDKEINELKLILHDLPKELNGLIKGTKQNLKY